jgi:ABC-2 type transport system ATP-binding protein
LEKCADFITLIEKGQIVASSEKNEFMESYRLLSGSESQLHQVKERLISYKINSFGFTGLIHSRDFDSSSDIKATTPSLEEIMIYFAKKEDTYV